MSKSVPSTGALVRLLRRPRARIGLIVTLTAVVIALVLPRFERALCAVAGGDRRQLDFKQSTLAVDVP